MKLEVFLVLGAVAITNVCAQAANADSYSSVTTTTTQEAIPVQPVTVIESRTTTLESAPITVVREQPVIITQPSREVLVVRQRRHHSNWINVGPVHVF